MVRKSLSTIVVLLLVSPLLANMANPVQKGSSGTTPFTAEHVRILHERIDIRLDEFFSEAFFDVEYRIEVEESGRQIPLIFYAPGFSERFEVLVNGQPVSIPDPGDEEIRQRIYQDFAHAIDDDYVQIKWAEGHYEWYYLEELVFFEADLEAGEHTVNVSYAARPWVDSWGTVKKYDFRYSLSPAEHWKEFGGLEIRLDATRFEKPYSTNLDNFEAAVVDGIQIWQFGELPAEFIIVNFQPEVSGLARTMIGFGPENLAFLMIILLIAIHLILIKRSLHATRRRFNWTLISGIVIIPFLITLSYSFASWIIDGFIGPHATGRHGMFIVLIMAYPLVLAVYGILIWLISKWMRRRNAKTVAG